MDSFTGAAVARHQYGYDRGSNRLWRDDLVNASHGELYGYDGLGQVASFDRGTLDGTRTGLTGAATRTMGWDLDALGNFAGVDLNGTTTSRTHDAQNEVTGVGGNTLTYDPNGNMTTDETGRQFRYDAWNRLVQVRNSSGALLETFAYDGLGRRISTTPNSGSATDLYHSAGWQVIEERVSGTTTARYVWSPVYVDALVLRDRDTDADGTLDERLYAVQDANWNVVALVNTSGAVVERYEYDPFGAATVLTGSYGSRGTTSYGWVHLFQDLRWDATAGQYFTQTRGLSPTLGRWDRLDPILYSAGDANLYRVMGNNSVKFTDPSGLDVFDWYARNAPSWAVPGGPIIVPPPSGRERLIPVRGSVIQAQSDLSRGNVGGFVGNTVSAAAEAVGIAGLARHACRQLVRQGLTPLEREAAEVARRLRSLEELTPILERRYAEAIARGDRATATAVAQVVEQHNRIVDTQRHVLRLLMQALGLD